MADPLGVAHRLGCLTRHDDRQPVLPAQPVRNGPDLAVIFLGRDVVLFPGLRVHRIEHQVGVDVPFVDMGANHHLIVGQILRRKFLCDFQRQLRSDFAGLEGLDNMVALASAHFPDLSFGIQHLTAFPARVTVLMDGEDLAVGLVAVQHILDDPVYSGTSG